MYTVIGKLKKFGILYQGTYKNILKSKKLPYLLNLLLNYRFYLSFKFIYEFNFLNRDVIFILLNLLIIILDYITVEYQYMVKLLI